MSPFFAGEGAVQVAFGSEPVGAGAVGGGGLRGRKL